MEERLQTKSRIVFNAYTLINPVCRSHEPEVVIRWQVIVRLVWLAVELTLVIGFALS